MYAELTGGRVLKAPTDTVQALSPISQHRIDNSGKDNIFVRCELHVANLICFIIHHHVVNYIIRLTGRYYVGCVLSLIKEY